MTEASNERRRFSRIAFEAPVQLEADALKWEAHLIDISFKGVLVQKPSDWPSSAPEHFKMSIPLDAENTIHTTLRLVHAEATQLGFAVETLDLDSATLLRRLVELNLGDESLLEREMAALVNG